MASQRDNCLLPSARKSLWPARSPTQLSLPPARKVALTYYPHILVHVHYQPGSDTKHLQPT